MKPAIKFYKSEAQHRTLTLEIDSDLNNLNLESFEPLWKTLETSTLEGHFRFVVSKKIQGIHEQGTFVKIIGLNRIPSCVTIKCQCSPEYCYEGSLWGKNGDDRTIGGSLINQTLREIAGIAWYNPDKPVVKKPETISPPKPLVSVGTALTTAVTPPEPAPSVPPKNNILHGISQDFEKTKKLFEEMARKTASGKISSIDISDTILTFFVSDIGTSRKSCGPVMTAWVNKGWLKREGKKGSAMIYAVTEAAINTFSLSFTPSMTANVVKTPEGSLPVMSEAISPSDNNLLSAFRIIREKAEKLQTAKSALDELELQKMRLEDEFLKIQTRIETLKPTLNDPDLQEALNLWLGLQKGAQKT